MTRFSAKERTVCFSGHRPQRLPWGFDESDPRHAALLGRLSDAIAGAYADGYRFFISGGAVGVDIWAAERTLALKASLPAVQLLMALPCGGQEHSWPDELRARYYGLLSRADEVYVLQPFYTRGCMAVRNQFMVDRSSRLIIVYDGADGGGTLQTMDMAVRGGLEIRRVAVV